MTICALYIRVSTGEQAPGIQLDILRRYADDRRFIVYRDYIDIISGIEASRPQLDHLLKDMRKGMFKTVICLKLDRLGRSLQHLINIAVEFNNNSIDLICVDQNIDTTTPGGKLTFHVLGAVAEFERELISERTKQGLAGASNVGKRGKDKKPRRKAGYLRRWSKE
jgi:DNA invertase Pin-like site-specific DNA recombinase